MSLNESIVPPMRDAALEWFAELVRQLPEVGHRPHLAPGEPAAERDSFGEVVQFRVAQTLTRPLPRGEEKREAIRQLNPAIPEKAREEAFSIFNPIFSTNHGDDDFTD